MPPRDLQRTAPNERTSSRTRTRGGRERLFFGGSSYLGLADDPRVVGAATEALARFGVSAGAARGTSGTSVEHVALEEELAAFAGAEACALVPDAALGDLALALARIPPGARVRTDAEAHPAIVDALRTVGATRVLEEDAGGCEAVLVDGTFPCAARVVTDALLGAADFVGVDDAHGFGVLGERGGGAAERLDLRSDAHALVLSLSKALGCAGGAVLGSVATVAAVRATSPYACTTAPPPATVAAARAALAVLRDEPGRRTRVLEHARRLHAALDAVEPAARAILFPVRALALATEERTARLHARLLDADVDVPLVRYPGGPPCAYLRFAVTAAHTDEDLARLERVLASCGEELCAS